VVGYPPGQIDMVAEKWSGAINDEVRSITGSNDLRIRMPHVSELTEASWMRFGGGQRITSVSNWAVMEGSRVVRYAYVEGA